MKNDSISNIGDVALKGPLGHRLDLMIRNHVASTDVDYITAPFLAKTETNRWWQTEFWGKWMHSAVPLLAYRPDLDLLAKVRRGVARILASQESDGYIGNYPDALRCGEGWDVWGVKYTLMGLLHYHDLVKRLESGIAPEGAATPGADAPSADEALGAARRLCAWLARELGPGGRRGLELWQTGNWCGYASSSVLEPVVWLYRRTGDRATFDFASSIVKGLSVPESGPRLVDLALEGVHVADRNGHGNVAETDGAYVMKHNRWKAYEMMSCYQGMLDYAETAEAEGLPTAVPPERLRAAAIAAARDIAAEEVNLAGGCASSEAWFHGARKQHLAYTRLQETCVTTTWMRLCEKLLDVTDDPFWADQIERTFHNAYLAAMKRDGSEFAGYTPLSGSRWHGQNHCYMHTDCCNANGPRGFLSYLRKFLAARGDVATLNFYASAIASATLGDGRKVEFDCYSLYPRSGSARLVCRSSGAFALRLRIPAHCASAKVSANGVTLGGARPGSYFEVRREWNPGDIVEVEFDMPILAHVYAHHAAFTRGPLLLARDSRFNDGDLSEPFRPGALTDGSDCSSMFAPAVPPSDDFAACWSASLPLGAHAENPDGALPAPVLFCDYASAGDAWRRDNYYRTWFPVELQPSEEPDRGKADS